MKRWNLRRLSHKRRLHRRLTMTVVIIFCIVGLVGLTFFRCRPIMTAFAESQAVWIATKIANDTVAQVLHEYADLCNNTISITYDGLQKVSSIRTDTTSINLVRTEIASRSISSMEKSSVIQVSLPLGTLLGWSWCSGFGPLVRFPISYTATILTNVSSSLTAVGINQSTYRVLIHLDISLYVVSPMGRTTVCASTSYPIAEAALLGEVPNSMTEVYGDDQSLLGQIFDYGTHN